MLFGDKYLYLSMYLTIYLHIFLSTSLPFMRAVWFSFIIIFTMFFDVTDWNINCFVSFFFLCLCHVIFFFILCYVAPCLQLWPINRKANYPPTYFARVAINIPPKVVKNKQTKNSNTVPLCDLFSSLAEATCPPAWERNIHVKSSQHLKKSCLQACPRATKLPQQLRNTAETFTRHGSIVPARFGGCCGGEKSKWKSQAVQECLQHQGTTRPFRYEDTSRQKVG